MGLEHRAFPLYRNHRTEMIIMSWLVVFILSLFAIVVAAPADLSGGGLEPVNRQNGPATGASTTVLLNGRRNHFSAYIEGGGTDSQGNSHFVAFRRTVSGALCTPKNSLDRPCIGKLSNSGEVSLFFKDTEKGTTFNGIRFARDGTAYAADTGNKRIIKISVGAEAKDRKARTLCRGFLQANDLTISRSGLIYVSGQHWESSTGELKACTRGGKVVELVDVQKLKLNRTNGIDLSRDEKTLYFTSAATLPGGKAGYPKLFKVKLNNTGFVDKDTKPEMLFDFTKLKRGAVDPDGLRIDEHGVIYVTLNGGSGIALISPSGKHLRTIKTTTKFPTNLDFGGSDGRTIRVCGRCGEEFGKGPGCVEEVRSAARGRWFGVMKDPPCTQ